MHSQRMSESSGLMLSKRVLAGAYNKLDKNTLFKLNTKINSIKNRIHYSTPADPWHSIRVSTDTVAYRCDTITNTVGLASVENGDWDLPSKNTDINKDWRIKGLKQRFEEGWNWDDTIYYKTVVENIKAKGSFWGYDSIRKFEERLEYNDYLFERVSGEGYKEDAGLDPKIPDPDIRTGKYRSMNQLQVLLCIGRNGRFLLKEGHHRFAIADILGLNIPVLILARHHIWQELRDKVGEAKYIKDLTPELQELVDHPDMDDVRPATGNNA